MGVDVYAGTVIGGGYWSDSVTFVPAGRSGPARVTVGAVNAATVSLSGTVGRVGDIVTLTITVAGAPFQEQLTAVCDVAGGAVFSNGAGYFLFSSLPLAAGSSHAAVSGFGAYQGGQPACFVAGTRIETARGPIAVERLRAGDRARAHFAGGFQPVVWTGFRRASAGAPDQQAVRIAAHAFGPAMPIRDLRLSPDHAVFIDGVLVPIRYLVNGASIARVPGVVTYWHVELAAHDVIFAEGLPTESYLDTGNRHTFSCAQGFAPRERPPATRGAEAIWAARACAKLELDTWRLAGARMDLRDRARLLGCCDSGDARLRVTCGAADLSLEWDGAQARAIMPARGRALRLRSRTAVPWQQRAASSDERRLGVAVTRLRVDQHDVPLASPALRVGWHAVEPGLRWTDGDASLLLPPSSRQRTIEIWTAPMLRYWSDAADHRSLAA